MFWIATSSRLYNWQKTITSNFGSSSNAQRLFDFWSFHAFTGSASPMNCNIATTCHDWHSTVKETNRVVALEPVGRTVTSVWKPCRTCDLIGSVLAVLVTVTNELHVDTVVAVAAELIKKTLTVCCKQSTRRQLLLVSAFIRTALLDWVQVRPMGMSDLLQSTKQKYQNTKRITITLKTYTSTT